MAILIEDILIERLARDLAELAGESVTVAVGKALAERLNRVSDQQHKTKLLYDLAAIRRRCATMPILDGRQPEDIIGYDENGIPGDEP